VFTLLVLDKDKDGDFVGEGWMHAVFV
jgi:hypothetical protein